MTFTSRFEVEGGANNSGIQVRKAGEILRNSDEPPQSLLGREAYVVGGGLKDGFSQRLSQAQHEPGLASLEIVGSAVVGAGLAQVNALGGRYSMVAKGAAGLLGLGVVADVARRIVPSLGAAQDTFHNPDHNQANRAVIASNLGTALFDYPVMAAGGILGAARVAHNFRALERAINKSAGSDLLSPAENSSLKLRSEADMQLAIARRRFYEIASGGVDSNNVRASRISTEELQRFLKGPEFPSWVSSEKASGNQVFWPTDVDKTLASGDIFTHFFKWRAENGKFSPEQLKIIETAVKELVPSAKSATPQDVLKLWEAKEAGGEGIALNDFWHKIYWPSQKGMTLAEKVRQTQAFAPSYADKVYPGVKEINRSIEDAGAHVVIVSNGDGELAMGVSEVLGIKKSNVIGSNTIFGNDGLSTGKFQSYEIFEGPWTKLPQPGKAINFQTWLKDHARELGWKHLNEDRVVIAGFNGDSASADGGMMVFSKRKGIGNFMVDTPGEPSRLDKFYSLADQFANTKGEFITLTRQPSAFDLSSALKLKH